MAFKTRVAHRSLNSSSEDRSGTQLLGVPPKQRLIKASSISDQVKNSPDIIEVKQGSELYVIIDEPKIKNKSEDPEWQK